jgi:hypothetical protein
MAVAKVPMKKMNLIQTTRMQLEKIMTSSIVATVTTLMGKAAFREIALKTMVTRATMHPLALTKSPADKILDRETNQLLEDSLSSSAEPAPSSDEDNLQNIVALSPSKGKGVRKAPLRRQGEREEKKAESEKREAVGIVTRDTTKVSRFKEQRALDTGRHSSLRASPDCNTLIKASSLHFLTL